MLYGLSRQRCVLVVLSVTLIFNLCIDDDDNDDDK